MPNYKESNITGTQYTRAKSVVFQNTDGAVPSVLFTEENVINLTNKKIYELGRNLFKSYDATATFPVFDPVAGELSTTEFRTHEQLFNDLYGLYLSTAVEYDTIVVPAV
jgi:hypothetical protein